MSVIRQDRELEQYRNLMLPPSHFEEGFRWSSLLGAIFIALLMVPGAMYMSLVAGFGLGQAAQWVTVILFIEVARRAHKTLTRPELFVLFYMASAAMASPFSGLLWNQFYVQSQAAAGMGVAQHIPAWWAPKNPEVLDQRSFMMWEWMPIIGLIIFGTLVGRINNMILGYGLFRLASDVEKLPFPMAPIGASGIMALAEQSEEEKEKEQGSWRWRVFSIGGVLGLAFGAIYIGLPTISGALLPKPIIVLPIPFSDWTTKTQDVLPAVAIGLCWDLSQLVTGMVLPFFAMLGSFVAVIVIMIANPILYHFNILHSWRQNDDTIRTTFNNYMDFYFSFWIGVAIAIALVSISFVVRAVRKRRKAQGMPATAPAGESLQSTFSQTRGDIRTPVIIGTYLVTVLSYILISGYLIDWHRNVMLVLLFFGFVYTPIINYVAVKLEGMAGQTVDIPMVREAAFILSGYTGGVTIWFLPVPQFNYVGSTLLYRQAELTGTRFSSIWKSEVVLIPIVVLASIFFANFIWSLAPIPSAQYPFTERMWELNAANQSIMYSSTLGRFSEFERAFNPAYLASGTLFGVLLFSSMSLLHLPILFCFGMLRGLNQALPHMVVPQFIGALLGRFYFEKRLGLKWRQYVPVVAAGFSCGMGLITVLCVGVTFLRKAVIQLPY